ncbi:MAG: hypothetical protein HYT69_02750 [Candidatus Zambryskibacteria bacterium]|nr:hypothetical protein [Candidatus Zambryskibacteria bacterium]
MKTYSNIELKRNVMIRVYTIYLLRKMVEPFFMKFFLFGALFITFVSMVDIPHVILNVISSVEASGNAFSFFSTAFSHSVLAIKLIILAEFLVGLALAKDTFARLTSLKINPHTVR